MSNGGGCSWAFSWLIAWFKRVIACRISSRVISVPSSISLALLIRLQLLRRRQLGFPFFFGLGGLAGGNDRQFLDLIRNAFAHELLEFRLRALHKFLDILRLVAQAPRLRQ